MNRLVRFGFNQGTVTKNSAVSVVVGEEFPASTSTALFGVCTDYSDNVYISDTEQNVIYRVQGNGKTGIFAGTLGAAGFANGAVGTARFQAPRGLAADKSNNIYVADSLNGCVRKINDRGEATLLASGFTNPTDVAIDRGGNIYVADAGAHRIYKVESHGRKFIIAGDGTSGNVFGAGVSDYASRIKGTAAKFNTPISLDVDHHGNVYVADSGNKKIKVIDSSGYVTQLTDTEFSQPEGIAVHPYGLEVTVLDRTETQNRIKKVRSDGQVSTINYLDTDSALSVAIGPNGDMFAIIAEFASRAAGPDDPTLEDYLDNSSSSSEKSESESSESESSQTESMSSSSYSSSSYSSSSSSSYSSSSLSSSSSST